MSNYITSKILQSKSLMESLSEVKLRYLLQAFSNPTSAWNSMNIKSWVEFA